MKFLPILAVTFGLAVLLYLVIGWLLTRTSPAIHLHGDFVRPNRYW